jgi:formylglycine-generating enzyme required for sulfatase activity
VVPGPASSALGALAPAPPSPPAPAPRAPARSVPPLRALVAVPAGTYRLGEGGEQRAVTLRGVRLGRWPVVNAHLRRFVEETGRPVSPALAARLADPQLDDHPATQVAYDDAVAFCAWAAARLPTGDEWEAAARGPDGCAWPWGDVFDPERCACVEAGSGWTVPVTAHPAGAAPCGAEQLAGNVWEWVADRTEDGEWRAVRGGCYLDHAWGVRAARVLSADPARATFTTGFRIAVATTTQPGREP